MKQTKRILGIVMAVCLSMSACGKEPEAAETEGTVISVHADYPHYETAQELVDSAELVFSGKVEKISCEMLDVRTPSGTESAAEVSESQEIPYTLYEIKITKVYKGSYEDDTIIIKRPGGQYGGTEYALDEAPDISQGETYLILAETYENSYASLLNVTQASYDMNAPEAYSEAGEGEITLSQILDLLE